MSNERRVQHITANAMEGLLVFGVLVIAFTWIALAIGGLMAIFCVLLGMGMLYSYARDLYNRIRWRRPSRLFARRTR